MVDSVHRTLARKLLAYWNENPDLLLEDAIAALVFDSIKKERKRCARLCESMVIGGRGAWTEEQAIAAKALLGAAKSIREGKE